MPVAVPRAGFTILDSRTEKLMTRYGLELRDLFHGEDTMRERMAARLVPPALAARVRETSEAITGSIAGLERDLAGFDPTLARALERSARKITYQIGKIERKAGREAMRRHTRAVGDGAYIYGLIYPERHLQERLYSFLPLAAKHGFELVRYVYDAIQLDCVDHRVMVA
jgi:uncharacterized protein YllA (UPF0747 family)